MLFSPEDRKKYGCWLCVHYKAEDGLLPLLANKCYPCLKRGIAKGPYDPPCDFFILREALLRKAKKKLGELAEKRLELRQFATSNRVKEGTYAVDTKLPEGHMRVAIGPMFERRSKKPRKRKEIPSELPEIPLELRHAAFRCMTTAGGATLYVRKGQARVSNETLLAIEECGLIKRQPRCNQWLFKPPFNVLVRHYLNRTITSSELAAKIGLDESELESA